MLACEGLKIVQSLWMWELAYQSHFAQGKKKVKKILFFAQVATTHSKEGAGGREEGSKTGEDTDSMSALTCCD